MRRYVRVSGSQAYKMTRPRGSEGIHKARGIGGVVRTIGKHLLFSKSDKRGASKLTKKKIRAAVAEKAKEEIRQPRVTSPELKAAPIGTQHLSASETSRGSADSATPTQIWELMLFLRIPHERAMCYTFDQAAELLGRLSSSQRASLLSDAKKQARRTAKRQTLGNPTGFDGEISSDTFAVGRRNASPARDSKPTGRRRKQPSGTAERAASKPRAKKAGKKAYWVPIGFCLEVDAKSKPLAKAAAFKLAMSVLKQAKKEGLRIDFDSAVCDSPFTD